MRRVTCHGKKGGREGGREAWLAYLLPGPVGHHQGGVADVTANIIKPFVFGEGAMATVMPNDEQAPHEETYQGRAEREGGREGR